MTVDTPTIDMVRRLSSWYSRAHGVSWEDLTQEVLVTLLEVEDDIDNLGGFVRTIVRNKAVNMVRTEARELLTDWGGNSEEAADRYHPYAEDGFEQAEARADVEAIFAAVPKHERAILELVYLGYNLREAADVLGIKHATAKKRFARAKERLQ